MKPKGTDAGKAGGAPIGSRQGGAPEAAKATDLNEQGRAHPTRTERGNEERRHLVDNPNYNQAGNELGSQDQSSGSQTGADIE